MQNYTGHGWEGKEYAKRGFMGAAELSKEIRSRLKEQFPTCKFSVTKESYSGGRSISISLMEAPFEVFETPTLEKALYLQGTKGFYQDTAEQILEYWNKTVDKGHNQVNQYYVKDDYMLTEKGKEIMQKAIDIAQEYNYDDSDAQIDYFSTNFYLHPSIGKWDKPFKKL
jgi:hypothetical protein